MYFIFIRLRHFKVLALSICLLLSCLTQAIDIQQIHQAAQSKDIQLSEVQINNIQEKKLTAALVWHGSSSWVNAVTRGAKDTFAQLGIDVVAVTDAQFDPAKQVADLENITMLNPDIILSLSVDGTSTKMSYRKAIAKGAKLVLLSNPIPDFIQGEDYVGIVTDDMLGMGKAAADLMADAVNKQGNIGIIYHDASYFITNNRDRAFRQALSQHAQLNVIAEKGFLKEHETANIAAAMVLQNPQLDAIYISWDTAAEGVIEALRSLGRRDIKVITHDLGINNLLDMAMGGNMYATVSDRPYDIGQTMAKLAGLSTLGQQAAPFTLVPFDTVKKGDINAVWQQAFKVPLPRLLNQALSQGEY